MTNKRFIFFCEDIRGRNLFAAKIPVLASRKIRQKIVNIKVRENT